MVKRTIRQLIPAAGLVLALAAVANAGLVTVNMAGTASGIGLPMPAGSPFTGYYVYDDAQTHPGTILPGGAVATYTFDDTFMQFEDGSTLFFNGGTLRIWLADDGFNHFYRMTTAGGRATGALAPWDYLFNLDIHFHDPTYTSIPSFFPDLPNPEDLADLFSIIYGAAWVGYGPAIEFMITDLSTTPPPVPAPAAVILTALGAALVPFLRRRYIP